MNSELWHACAGPLVSLPPVGSLVVYFPQGHSEQVSFFSDSVASRYLSNLVADSNVLLLGCSIYAEGYRKHT